MMPMDALLFIITWRWTTDTPMYRDRIPCILHEFSALILLLSFLSNPSQCVHRNSSLPLLGIYVASCWKQVELLKRHKSCSLLPPPATLAS